LPPGEFLRAGQQVTFDLDLDREGREKAINVRLIDQGGAKAFCDRYCAKAARK